MSYLENTPVYQLWNDIIGIMTPVFSSFLIDKGYRFKDVVCNREGVQGNYVQGELQIEITLNLEYRMLQFYRKDATGTLIDHDIFKLQEPLADGTSLNYGILSAIIIQWKESLIGRAML